MIDLLQFIKTEQVSSRKIHENQFEPLGTVLLTLRLRFGIQLET